MVLTEVVAQQVLVLHARLENSVGTVLVHVLTVLWENIPLVVLILVRNVPQARFQPLALVCALDAALANTVYPVLMGVQIALWVSFRQPRNLQLVRPVQAESLLPGLLVYAVYVLLADTVVLQVRTPVPTVMSENMLLVQACPIALIAQLESILGLLEAFALIAQLESMLTQQGLNLAVTVQRDQFRVTWEIPCVRFALQGLTQLAAVIRYVPHVLLARLTL